MDCAIIAGVIMAQGRFYLHCDGCGGGRGGGGGGAVTGARNSGSLYVLVGTRRTARRRPGPTASFLS